MAFDLNSVVPRYRSAFFSRGSVDLTVKLISNELPQIASELELLLTQQPLLEFEEDIDNIHKHHFYVNFDSKQVRSIVETLLAITEKQAKEVQPSLIILARSLFKEWMTLAQEMMQLKNTSH